MDTVQLEHCIPIREGDFILKSKFRLFAFLFCGALIFLGGCMGVVRVHHSADHQNIDPIETVGECRARIGLRGKRNRCMSCVSQAAPHVFLEHRVRSRQCKAVRPPPAPLPAAIKRVNGCHRAGLTPAMNARCRACVTRPHPHTYRPNNAPGRRCVAGIAPRPSAPPPPSIFHNRGQCKALGIATLRNRCFACVTRPRAHRFVANAPPGQRCQVKAGMAPPPPPPPPPAPVPRVMHNRGQCQALGIPTLRNRCIACVTRPRAHRFVTNAPQGRRCQAKGVVAPPPRPKPIPKAAPRIYHNRGQCKGLGIPTLRNRCFACVTRPRPHRFVANAPQGQRCQVKAGIAPKPKPKPKPARVIFNRNGCKSKIGARTTRARCMACVTRSRPHKFFPDARQGQRCRPR